MVFLSQLQISCTSAFFCVFIFLLHLSANFLKIFCRCFCGNTHKAVLRLTKIHQHLYWIVRKTGVKSLLDIDQWDQ